ncbi:hypothetical protein TcCL_ESM06323 [Trypanosoma cruzi]|nr:hypothetical protein TcCL_ESM06323 [Trypanosoma cruzi]
MARAAATRALTPRGLTTVSRHNAAGPDACRCRLHCANNNPTRETLLAPGFSRQYGIRPQLAANTQRTQSEQPLKEPHTRKRGPHPPMTRRLSPRGHTECTVSSIEIIRRPSLKNASVSDGP